MTEESYMVRVVDQDGNPYSTTGRANAVTLFKLIIGLEQQGYIILAVYIFSVFEDDLVVRLIGGHDLEVIEEAQRATGTVN